MKNSIIFTEDDKFKPITTLKVKYPIFKACAASMHYIFMHELYATDRRTI